MRLFILFAFQLNAKSMVGRTKVETHFTFHRTQSNTTTSAVNRAHVIEGQEVAMATSSVISFFPVRSLFLRHKETAVQHAVYINFQAVKNQPQFHSVVYYC